MKTTNASNISQKANYAFEFGEPLRSSGIFYFKSSKNFKTTISFLNYWQIRQNITIRPIANIRDMHGNLVKREFLEFTSGMVINYSPNLNKEFEGSIEIEIFSLNNLRIPYAALMATYRTDESVSMVHGYARVYSQHEVEEGRTITNGNEACIPLSSNSISEVVFHNGNEIMSEQIAQITINFDNNDHYAHQINIPEMSPFETKKINLTSLIPEKFNQWKFAEAYISFKLKNAFTRVLCIQRDEDGKDFQVTHSDFNYQIHKTDHVTVSSAFTPVPKILGVGENYQIMTWGANEQLSVTVDANPNTVKFTGTKPIALTVDKPKIIVYKADENEKLPSRIHNAIIIQSNSKKLPAICNLGISHAERPPKKMWWALVSANDKKCGLSFSALEDIYGLVKNEIANVRLYSEFSTDYLDANIPLQDLLKRATFSLEEIFPDYIDFLRGGYGYITFYSEYGGLILFTYILHNSGSLTVEHGF